MFRHKQKSIWTSCVKSIAVCSAAGLLIIFLSTLLFTAMIFFLMDSMEFSSFFSTAAALLGSFGGAYICGKHRRKKGLAEGIVCGFIIYTVLSLLGVFFGVGIQSAKSLIRLIASGAVGGVSGVNSKRPKRLTE